MADTSPPAPLPGIRNRPLPQRPLPPRPLPSASAAQSTGAASAHTDSSDDAGLSSAWPVPSDTAVKELSQTDKVDIHEGDTDVCPVEADVIHHDHAASTNEPPPADVANLNLHQYSLSTGSAAAAARPLPPMPAHPSASAVPAANTEELDTELSPHIHATAARTASMSLSSAGTGLESRARSPALSAWSATVDPARDPVSTSVTDASATSRPDSSDVFDLATLERLLATHAMTHPASVEGTPEDSSAESWRGKRHRVVAEIVSSEEVYIRHLTHLQEHIVAPLKRHVQIHECDTDTDADSVEDIFGRVGSLLPLQQNLLQDLRAAVATTGGDEADACLGTVFLRFAPYFKMYGMYCAQHASRTERLRQLRENDAAFQRKLTALETAPVLQGQSVFSLLIMPVQRIPRYILLLKELTKVTPADHADFSDVGAAIDKMESIATAVNVRIGQEEKQRGVMDVQRVLQPAPEPSLVQPDRVLLRQGNLKKLCGTAPHVREYRIFLFNDILVYGIPTSNGHVKLHGIINLIGVEPIPESTDIKYLEAHRGCIFAVLGQPKSLVLATSQREERDSWCADLRTCIADLNDALVARGMKALDLKLAAPVPCMFETAPCAVCGNRIGRLSDKVTCTSCGKRACADCAVQAVRMAFLWKTAGHEHTPSTASDDNRAAGAAGKDGDKGAAAGGATTTPRGSILTRQSNLMHQARRRLSTGYVCLLCVRELSAELFSSVQQSGESAPRPAKAPPTPAASTAAPPKSQYVSTDEARRGARSVPAKAHPVPAGRVTGRISPLKSAAAADDVFGLFGMPAAAAPTRSPPKLAPPEKVGRTRQVSGSSHDSDRSRQRRKRGAQLDAGRKPKAEAKIAKGGVSPPVESPMPDTDLAEFFETLRPRQRTASDSDVRVFREGSEIAHAAARPSHATPAGTDAPSARRQVPHAHAASDTSLGGSGRGIKPDQLLHARGALRPTKGQAADAAASSTQRATQAVREPSGDVAAPHRRSDSDIMRQIFAQPSHATSAALAKPISVPERAPVRPQSQVYAMAHDMPRVGSPDRHAPSVPPAPTQVQVDISRPGLGYAGQAGDAASMTSYVNPYAKPLSWGGYGAMPARTTQLPPLPGPPSTGIIPSFAVPTPLLYGPAPHSSAAPAPFAGMPRSHAPTPHMPTASHQHAPTWNTQGAPAYLPGQHAAGGTYYATAAWHHGGSQTPAHDVGGAAGHYTTSSIPPSGIPPSAAARWPSATMHANASQARPDALLRIGGSYPSAAIVGDNSLVHPGASHLTSSYAAAGHAAPATSLAGAAPPRPGFPAAPTGLGAAGIPGPAGTQQQPAGKQKGFDDILALGLRDMM